MKISSVVEFAEPSRIARGTRLILIGQKLNILRNPPQTSSTPAAMMKKLLQPHPGHMP
jgi:hypothetical protein